MNRIIKTAVIAAIAGIGVIGTTGAAQAYTPSEMAGQVGQYIGTEVFNPGTKVTTKIENVDMNVELVGSDFYHEYDLTFSPAVDGVITFEGVGKERRDDGEVITGSIDTTNKTVTWFATYVLPDGTWYPGTRWGVETLPYTVDPVSGDLDFYGVSGGEQMRYEVKGGFRKLTAPAPAPVAGNHGQYVSGAVKAGKKGKELAAIAQDVTLVGPYVAPTV